MWHNVTGLLCINNYVWDVRMLGGGVIWPKVSELQLKTAPLSHHMYLDLRTSEVSWLHDCKDLMYSQSIYMLTKKSQGRAISGFKTHSNLKIDSKMNQRGMWHVRFPLADSARQKIDWGQHKVCCNNPALDYEAWIASSGSCLLRNVFT